MSSMTSDLREMAKDETAKLKMVLNELIRKKIAEEVIKRLKDLDLLSLVSPSPTASKTSANQMEANDETTPKHNPQDQNTATESSAQAGPSKISKEESPKLSKVYVRGGQICSMKESLAEKYKHQRAAKSVMIVNLVIILLVVILGYYFLTKRPIKTCW
ncbi:unnamed protein product [Clavelina lepadiformis]|uniref:Uncharacterized protein n=1 Tax=Clavelina lepadiformis TaxID=159417 RepID=A0ABP0EZ79_CLALP